MKTKNTRRDTREQLMILFYQLEFQDFDSADAILDKLPVESERERSFAKRLIEAFWERREDVDKAIEAASKSWSISRMNKVDLALLRIAVTELLYLEEVPTEVSIHEAMELSKRYSADDAFSFINGVLGHVAEQRS